MAVNRRPSKERLNLDPGLSGKTNFGGNNHLKLFLNVSQTKLKGRTGECRSTRVLFWEPDGGSNFVKFRKLRCNTKENGNPFKSSGEGLAIEGADRGEDLREAQIQAPKSTRPNPRSPNPQPKSHAP